MLPVGSLIDNRYEILDALGSGGGGEVYRVRDHHEGDEVALKIINPATLTPLGGWAEAQILRRLSDNHILPIRNAFAQAGHPIVVTEIAHQGTVDDRITAEPVGLDTLQAIRWIRQACQGISRAHDLGLVHNDIKPGNLFLTANNDCRVGDFGFAGLIDPGTGSAPVYGGTFETMAPEVAASWGPLARATVASDVYSLAATAYWMLAGQPPHDLTGLATQAEVLSRVSTVPARRLRDVAPHVPDPIARVVDRALSMTPTDRPSTPHQLSADLGRPVNGRRWRRTDEHGSSLGHLACWRGTASGHGGAYLLCMTQGARAAQRVLTAVHATSGNRISRGCATATQATWPGVVRRVMRALG
ncbi:serine/threonine protein kinase [Nocardioides sp. LMS-CY]|uniref:serine/threonine-protein kinase n=1 Tax=Nocardioides sp. (strain LMS-CY) TaxID=2840457 RepID=UPI001C0071DB|nr:serine/threonine-protein kinase [Nocardioides sp. LMS-CY]QWF21768.1 serine/threonine protein kinase [Nocardioides sp. LMS-CY]